MAFTIHRCSMDCTKASDRSRYADANGACSEAQYLILYLTRHVTAFVRSFDFVRSISFVRSSSFVRSISFVTEITAMCYCRNLHAIV